MKLKVYFVFLPSQELLTAASSVTESELCEVSVWSTYETDRGGLEFSQQELELAFWLDFKAKLIYENETQEQKQFRDHCLELGFYKCWNVLKTTLGGDANDIMESGKEANNFLKSYST